MVTTRYTPLRDVGDLHDEVERFFRQAFGRPSASSAGAFSPPLDVREDEESFVLIVELPGVSPDAVEVSLDENTLTIAGERPFYEGADPESFRRVERHVGRFHRAVRLPDRVDGDHVQATYRDGLLTITVPKAEEAKPRRIQVTAS